MDRLSDLPDCLLLEILSYLDTKFVVQSSILSPRFKKLWMEIPSLIFRFRRHDNQVSPHTSQTIISYSPKSSLTFSPRYMNPYRTYSSPTSPHYPEPDTPSLEDRMSAFLEFVLQVLKRREGTKVDRVDFLSDVGVQPCLVNSILSQVAVLKVQEIGFHAETIFQTPVELPECLYVNESLVKLQITASWISFSGTLSLAALKELRLHGLDDSIDTKRDNFPRGLFLKCPVLEVLSFSDCSLSGSKVMVSPPRLKELEIVNSLFESLAVSAPLLQQVYVDLKRRKTYHTLLEMLRQLKNARCIVVSVDTLEVLSAAAWIVECELLLVSPLEIPNLKDLIMNSDNKEQQFRLKYEALGVELLIQVHEFRSTQPKMVKLII